MIPTDVPSTSSLRCFESAARHQSYTDASHELGMTQSAVSKKIKELEQKLGIDLFRRIGRGVILTPAGQGFAEDVARHLGQLQTSVQKAVSAGNGNTALSVAALPTFANLWLIPRLPDFAAKHPEIRINLFTRPDPFDFDKDQLDLAFHYGSDNWPGTRMTRLFEEVMVPVCSPAFFDRHALDTTHSILSAPLLHLQSRPEAWAGWFEKAGIAQPACQDGQYFDQYSMIISAALVSLGAAIVPASMVGREISQGVLRQIDGPQLATQKNYYLVRPYRQAPEAVGIFENWVRKQARNT